MELHVLLKLYILLILPILLKQSDLIYNLSVEFRKGGQTDR